MHSFSVVFLLFRVLDKREYFVIIRDTFVNSVLKKHVTPYLNRLNSSDKGS